MSLFRRAMMAAAGASAPPALTLPTTDLLEAWDARTGVSDDGSRLSWTGVHASAVMAITHASRPVASTTGGLASIEFSGGAGSYLTHAGLSAPAGPRTVYTVLDLSSVSGTIWYADIQSGRWICGILGGEWVLNNGSIRSSGLTATTGLHVITTQQQANADARIWADGVAGTLVSPAGSVHAVGGTMSLGATYTGSSGLIGHILLHAIYKAGHDAAARAAVWDYIAQEWGV